MSLTASSWLLVFTSRKKKCCINQKLHFRVENDCTRAPTNWFVFCFFFFRPINMALCVRVGWRWRPGTSIFGTCVKYERRTDMWHIKLRTIIQSDCGLWLWMCVHRFKSNLFHNFASLVRVYLRQRAYFGSTWFGKCVLTISNLNKSKSNECECDVSGLWVPVRRL